MHSSRDKRDRTAYLIKIGLFRAAMTLCKLRASLSSEVFLKKQMVHFQSYDSSYHDFFTTPFYTLVNGNGHHRVLWIMEWHIKNVDRQHLLALLSLYKNNLASSWIYRSVENPSKNLISQHCERSELCSFSNQSIQQHIWVLCSKCQVHIFCHGLL